MVWPEPQFSKNEVKRAGKRVAEAFEKDGLVIVGANMSSQDYKVIENWRSSHGAVLNTAQAWLRRQESEPRPIIGQRLKRYRTIIDKLGTGRAKDLSTLNDIAGVRAIFNNMENLIEFEEKMLSSRAKHKLLHSPDKYDYIAAPKPTGYRGKHFVYERHTNALSGEPWDGLRFEVQLRTYVQHAWATAVEVYDSTINSRYKFESSVDPSYLQFQVISEILARRYEKCKSCMPELSYSDLIEMAAQLEAKTKMVATIENLQIADSAGVLRKNTILQKVKSGELIIHSYYSFAGALSDISRIESNEHTTNAVLVRALKPQQIREAFRNYFDDTKDFVALLREAMTDVSG